MELSKKEAKEAYNTLVKLTSIRAQNKDRRISESVFSSAVMLVKSMLVFYSK